MPITPSSATPPVNRNEGPESVFADPYRAVRKMVIDVVRRIEFLPGSHRRLHQSSRTKNAMEKTSMVATKEARKPATTTSS